ncbi:MAG: peptide chain release factor N(5)-glutamine methyltransferase [Vicingaceae bacterium]|nr:peptide chain release factor N(5)-glutamine methyltransferase [Vicingaceae bacterium]
MKLGNNTLKAACNYFKKELRNTYDESELNQILQISFHHFFGLSRAELIFNQDDLISEENVKKIIELVTALKTNKPLAQIIGEWEFYGMKFKVNENTLIPRPETEELVHLIVEENKNVKNCKVLDIGTGTGCIAVALKSEMEAVNVSAFDISTEALKTATENAKLNKLNVSFEQVNILDWKRQKLVEKYDLIVSNPPYIPEKEKNLMQQNVLGFEPELALFVNDNEPLIFYEVIADFAIENLTPNGKLYFEINENYGQETKQMLANKTFKNVTIVKDLNGKDRIIKANL